MLCRCGCNGSTRFTETLFVPSGKRFCFFRECSALGKRIASIERLRILAAFGIVWFHIGEGVGRLIGYAGLPLFLMIYCMLIVMKGGQDYRDFISKKFKRLLRPWLFWSVVYFMCDIAKIILEDVSYHRMFNWRVLLMGTSMHLWYLPYAFLIGISINASQKWAHGLSKQGVGLCMMTAGLVSLVLCSFLLSTYRFAPPLAQWVFGFSACPLGCAMGYFAMKPIVKRSITAIVVGVSVVVVCVVLFLIGCKGLAIPYGVATCSLLIALIWQGRLDRLSAFVAPLTFGIYLIHPFVGKALGYMQLDINRGMLGICLIFAASLGISFIAKRLRLGIL